MNIKKCPKTTSGKHKWKGQFDGADKIEMVKNPYGYMATMVITPKVIKKCEACGLYDY